MPRDSHARRRAPANPTGPPPPARGAPARGPPSSPRALAGRFAARRSPPEAADGPGPGPGALLPAARREALRPRLAAPGSWASSPASAPWRRQHDGGALAEKTRPRVGRDTLGANRQGPRPAAVRRLWRPAAGPADGGPGVPSTSGDAACPPLW